MAPLNRFVRVMAPYKLPTVIIIIIINVASFLRFVVWAVHRIFAF